MAQSRKEEDNVQWSALTLRKDLKLVKAGKPVPAAGEGDDDEHDQGTETCTEPLFATNENRRSVVTRTIRVVISICRMPGGDPLIREAPPFISSWMGRTQSTAHGKDDCDFPDQPRTSKSDTKRRKWAPEYACNVFRTWSAAAVWGMTAITVATSSLAGAECIGTEVKLDKGEAVLRCPLPVNASATRQGIIIKHFPTPDSAGEVFHCDWPTEGAATPECESSNGFSLVGQLTNQVLAKVPVSRLRDGGAYKCQLYPLGDHKYFTPCHIHHSSDKDDGKRSAVMTTPVVSSNATDSSTPGQDPLIREAPPCVGQSSSVELTAVLVLQVIITILLVVNVLSLQNKKNLQ